MSYMFYDCSMLTELDGIGGLDTGNAVSMTCMFAECSSLYSLDLSGFDTSAAENLSRMFQNCRSLNSLDISGFVFGGNSVYIDIFAGTRWEGSSPLLDEAAETRSPSTSSTHRAIAKNSRFRNWSGAFAGRGDGLSADTVCDCSGRFRDKRPRTKRPVMKRRRTGFRVKTGMPIGKKDRVPIPLIYGDRDSFVQTPTGR